MRKSSAFFALFPAIVFLASFRGDSAGEYFLPPYPLSVCIADLDRDGVNEIIAGHSSGSGKLRPTITILDNNGHGAFVITDTSMVFAGYQENIMAVDVNKDGWPDIEALSYVEDQIYLRVYTNDHGDFPGFEEFLIDSAEPVTWVTHGDINGDTYPDLVYTSNWGIYFGVLYNDGTGHFIGQETVPLGFPPHMVYCCDLDNDGKDDVILPTSHIMVCFNQAEGWVINYIAHLSYLADEIGLADFNRDGFVDVTSCFVDISGICHVDLFMNNGNRPFQTMPGFSFKGFGTIFPADINNDLQPDLMFESLLGSFIWYNKGNFQFSDSAFVSIPCMGEYRRNFTCGDLDNNGYADILTVRYLDSDIYPNLDIRFNDGHGNFSHFPVSVNEPLFDDQEEFSAFPNPFRGKITFTAMLPGNAKVAAGILDIKGNQIYATSGKQEQSGAWQFDWQGIDNQGKNSPPGIYLALFKVDDKIVKSIKIVKMN